MSPLIIDASVAAKWILPPEREAFVEQAVWLFEQYTQGRLEFLFPDFFWAELGNVLWKAVLAQRCSRTAAEEGLARLRNHSFSTFPAEKIIERAFAIATDYKRTVYDSIYVALALEKSGQLITADEKLANALAAHLPVKWLGAWA